MINSTGSRTGKHDKLESALSTASRRPDDKYTTRIVRIAGPNIELREDANFTACPNTNYRSATLVGATSGPQPGMQLNFRHAILVRRAATWDNGTRHIVHCEDTRLLIAHESSQGAMVMHHN